MEAGMAVKAGVLAAHKDAEVIVKPLADGGEGTTDALIEGLNGERVDVTVTGPYHEPVNAYYGYLKDTNTAVMEMASAAGITISEQKDPMIATTYGVGEMILHAINKGIRNFIIGIGGSATNDGGIGMLKALGFTFLDKDGQDTGEGGQALAKVASVRLSDNAELLSQCNFKIACDVTNPLCGFQGATYIYGPQKGVTSEMLPVLDAGMENYAKVTSQTIGKDNMNASGAGAAGGLGFAFLSYLNGELTPGIQLILNAVHLEDEMKNADVVVTGEGRLDHQTAMGKAPVGVAKLGKNMVQKPSLLQEASQKKPLPATKPVLMHFSRSSVESPPSVKPWIRLLPKPIWLQRWNRYSVCFNFVPFLPLPAGPSPVCQRAFFAYKTGILAADSL